MLEQKIRSDAHAITDRNVQPGGLLQRKRYLEATAAEQPAQACKPAVKLVENEIIRLKDDIVERR